MSKDITTMLRHETHYKKFWINQFYDRRINIWEETTNNEWKIPSNWKSFKEMVEWKFRDRKDKHIGPSMEAAVAHFKKDGENDGYTDWNDYSPIFIIRAFQKHIDSQKKKQNRYICQADP
eukprot:3202447-Pyramimonas_sp.AAC.1